uniref:Condensin complex subunit 2 n=1 Tax=Cuerna arida TaxID=1464854 RepID=A0A1B6GHK2_9HEMI
MNTKRIPTLNNSLTPPLVVLKRIKLNTPSELLTGNHIPSIADEEEDERPQVAVGHQLHSKPTEQSTLLNLEDSHMHTMTKEELNEHVQKCLEMSSENKITSKNAFALRLIDCMGVLLQRQTDFSAIACTLDAGAKIYSYRVDALHKQVSKLADEVILYHSKKQTENDEDTDKKREKYECSGNKERRKLNKKTMIVSSDTLKRKLKGKDPKDHFIKIEPLPGALLTKVRRDPKDLHLILENNVHYWPIKRDYKPLKAEGTLSLPVVKVFRKEMKEVDQRIFSETVNNLNTMSENNEVDITDDIQMSPKEIDDANDFEVDTHQDTHCQAEGDKQLDEGCDIVSTAIQRINEKMQLIGKCPSQFDALKLLFKEADDYNYLDTKNVYYWAGPEFWKRPTRVVENGKTKCNLPKKKKMPKEISYDSTVSEVNGKWNKRVQKGQCSKKTILSDKTKNGWKNKKLTIPKYLDIEVKELIELFHISRHCGEEQPRSNSFSFDGVSINQDTNIETNCLNDDNISEISNYSDPLNSSFYAGPLVRHSDDSEVKDPLNSAFYDVGQLHSPGFRKHIHPGGDNYNENLITVEMLADNSPFDEDSLVPAPKLVNYQPIKYSARPIQVNMLHLKESIYKIIDQEIRNKTHREEQSYNPGPNMNIGTFTPETKFSDILQKLPSVLEKRTAEDVSPAIVFVALLTLANENNLDLQGCENFSDVIVKKENNTLF